MSNSEFQNKLLHTLSLLNKPLIGDVIAHQLIQHFGSAESVLKASFKQLCKIPGLGAQRAQSIKSKGDESFIHNELAFIEKNTIQVFFQDDIQYPQHLKNIPDRPLIIFKKGNYDLNHPRKIAIVGTRDYTSYGAAVTEKIIQELQAYNVQIVSGLAYGIDIIAHRKAVQLQIPTIGVLAHGLDRIYPAAHRTTAKLMLENGGLLTEYTSGTIPDKNNFPMRNRIVAGYADMVLVIESKAKGGALITAKIAASYNKDVGAVPGNINSEASEGCNYLIKTQIAHLVQSAEDIANILNWDTPHQQGIQTKLFDNLNSEEQAIVEVIKNKNPIHIDELLLKSRKDTSTLAAILLSLEMQSIIKPLAGKRFQLL